MGRPLRLGTRKSLLAWAQSSLVAEQLRRTHSGLAVELVGIETRGDVVQNIPLHQIDGKEFFVKEIDDALLSGKVDFTVHSLKDLSLTRPTGIALAAIPPREVPNDVIVFNRGVGARLQRGDTIRIGTSSPRRSENIPPFIVRALPQFQGAPPPRVELVEIRGNVNSRVERIYKESADPKYLDGVVLAQAGLARLWQHSSSHKEISALLQHVRFMVLPLSACPAAPGQGALAIECRQDDEATTALLRCLHDEKTAAHVGEERQLLGVWGGGCHQRFGATAIAHGTLGDVMFVRGKTPEDAAVAATTWASQPSPLRTAVQVWDGSLCRGRISSTNSAVPAAEPLAAFVAHARALPATRRAPWATATSKVRVWTSGISSWQQLAAQGIWVEGCADNLGYKYLEAILRDGVLQLPAPEEWTIFTHEAAQDTWRPGASVVSTYKVDYDAEPTTVATLAQADQVFWSSGSQFAALHKYASPQARHACGPGKTAEKLRASGIADLQVFPAVGHWRRWLGISHDG